MINADNKSRVIKNSFDGFRYSQFPVGNKITKLFSQALLSDFEVGSLSFELVDSLYPYTVYPINSEGIFANDTIPNLTARWRIVSADEENRWEWFNGGGYTFDADGLATGTYVATYEVNNWDGNGNDATALVTVTVT